MRYIGNKRRLLPFIYSFLQRNEVSGNHFCDLFSGTASVGQYFKTLGYQITSCDLLYSSYIQQKVKIAINALPAFSKIANYLRLKPCVTDEKGKYGQAVIHYLNQIPGKEGFVFQNYSQAGTKDSEVIRSYFTDENAKKIDAIRQTIEDWRINEIINENEFSLLLFALLNEATDRANTTGMQNFFLRQFYKKEVLTPIRLQLPTITASNLNHQVYCQDSVKLLPKLQDIDLLYVDPPYTSIQYGTAYHLMETIAKWHFPQLTGKAGLPNREEYHSAFCSKRKALQALSEVVNNHNYRYLLLSYSDEGIISHNDIVQLLQDKSATNTVALTEIDYPRYTVKKDNPNSKRFVKERLYLIKTHYAGKHDDHYLTDSSISPISHVEPMIIL